MSKLQLDYFIDPENKIYQHPEHFHFNTDSKLLANFMKIKPNERVLDIGCNNGALLSICDREEVSELVGVEILKEPCEVARKNASSFKHPVQIIHSSIMDFHDQPFDVIISNPPFFPVQSTHEQTKIDLRQLGRIEINLTLQQLIQCVSRLLKSNGRFYFVHRPNRLNEIAQTLYQYHMQMKTIQFAYDQNIVKSVLIEAIKESNCDCKVLQPIFIR
ncbi:tRNA1(Val) A37 N6-methylase TrmN6 [Faecalicoccus acidiformans]|uniref:tRNA1(Val) A37 N6-methylase TrmN6 n=1 Tax=Faecalicoccus acidiformans TaxID=915173 RepID=A0A7W8D4C7_9FIRM|nr:methyltransferase [Faecalicoccus acidiformans]MBB5185330.1 tRNA1(Val) A37 N6-methylase TrmN6 [Faecalicoccus acidiformans]